MTTKEWFSRGRRLDEHIKSLMETRDKLYADMTSMTARYTGDVVDGTKDPHKYDALAVMEDMIDREVDRLYSIRMEIIAVTLRMADTRYRDLLNKRYLSNETWEQIAVEMHYSYMHVCRMHGEALKAAEEVIHDTGV